MKKPIKSQEVTGINMLNIEAIRQINYLLNGIQAVNSGKLDTFSVNTCNALEALSILGKQMALITGLIKAEDIDSTFPLPEPESKVEVTNQSEASQDNSPEMLPSQNAAL